MKHIYLILFLGACFIASFNAGAQHFWHQQDPGNRAVAPQLISASHYLLYTLDESALRSQLTSSSATQIIELPLPDGSAKYFKVWRSSLLPPSLAAKYPRLSTFTAEDINNSAITAKLDFTDFGFHAVIFNGGNISFIDPADNVNSGYYMVHYKKDEIRKPEERSMCQTLQKAIATPEEIAESSRKMAARTSNGYVLRTYRLALSCDHEYAQAATGLTNPTIEQTFSKMITSMNRINGVYEREFSLTMIFAENEDTLIWTTDTGGVNGTDPFIGMDNIAYQCLSANQTVCDARIGTANYDIGHVFTTGAGGLSQVGVACRDGLKAQSVTGQPNPVGDGFDIDYVAHEMGHEYGADHPFNNGMDGSCSGATLNAPTAYEPGSGSTIMAYAGICAPDDLQPHSDAYFHSVSLQQIQSYITTIGDVCAVKTPTNNKLVSLPSFTASYTIPYLTPFELTAPVASDSVLDSSITYCWEEWNLGDVGRELINTHVSGPIFRSFFPKVSPTRVFPNDSMVLAGILSNAGHEDDEGEKVPDSARYLTFKLTVRDIYQGTGCFLIPDDSIHLDVINTGQGFAVTSQAIPGIYTGNSAQTVTWNVASTNISPINTSFVDIYMSADGGNTWPYHLGNFPNNGSATVIFPDPDSTISAARVKVKGTGNVFFNVNSADFKIVQNVDIKLFPVPAQSVIHITTSANSAVHVVIYNSMGQRVWNGKIIEQSDIPVSQWARGIYFLRSTDIENKCTVKKFVLN